MKKILFVAIALLGSAGIVYSEGSSRPNVVRPPPRSVSDSSVAEPTRPTDHPGHTGPDRTVRGCEGSDITINGNLEDAVGKWRLKIMNPIPDKSDRGDLKLTPLLPDTKDKCTFPGNNYFVVKENDAGEIETVIGDQVVSLDEDLTAPLLIPMGGRGEAALQIDCAKIDIEKNGKKASGYVRWSLKPYKYSATDVASFARGVEEFGSDVETYKTEVEALNKEIKDLLADVEKEFANATVGTKAHGEPAAGPVLCDNITSKLMFHKDRRHGEMLLDEEKGKEISGGYKIDITPQGARTVGQGARVTPSTYPSTKGTSADVCGAVFSAFLEIDYDPASAYVKIIDPGSKAVLFEGTVPDDIVEKLSITKDDGAKVTFTVPTIDIETNENGNLVISGVALNTEWKLPDGTACSAASTSFEGTKSAVGGGLGQSQVPGNTSGAKSGGGCSLIIKK